MMMAAYPTNRRDVELWEQARERRRARARCALRFIGQIAVVLFVLLLIFGEVL